MPTASQRRVARVAALAAIRSTNPTRHKCFISFHQDDEAAVIDFIDDFNEVFIAKIIGVSDTDDFIDSSDTDYGMRRIRELYLTDSTVTIVLLGKCTWARKYVDWEIASTLRDDLNNKRSGLLGISLRKTVAAPKRLSDNLPKTDVSDGYGRWIKYPNSDQVLRSRIDDAFKARDDSARYSLIDNSSALFKHNRPCS